MRILPQKIVCAVDFSEFTQLVLHNSIALAKRFKAMLILLHTIHHPEDALHGTTAFEHSGELKKQTAIAFNRMQELMRTTKVTWKPVILHGDPVEEIPRYAQSHHVDLVIAASHGISGIKRLLIGTVVERLARKLKQPLLVLKAGKQQNSSTQLKVQPGAKLIICCDLTKDSEKLVEYGLMWAHDSQLSVVLLHAIETPVNEEEIDSSTAPYSEIQQMLQARLESKILNMIPETYIGCVPFTAKTITGQAKDILPDAAEKIGASVVILGVRDHSILGQFLVGSTTEAILRHTPCSVLTLPVNYDTQDNKFD